ncbi:MAG TPA: hypothetical protein VIM89_03940 [Mucilaginibacter sp.]
MKINTEINDKGELPDDFNDLKPHVREKALEIASQLTPDDIPEGSTRIREAIQRAEEWFTDLEG